MWIRFLAATVVLVSAAPAAGQGAGGLTIATEAVAGYAGFLDDATIDHAIAGGSARLHLLPRVGIGPEIVYMRGPGGDRDLFVTGNMTFDIGTAPRDARQGAVNAFLVAGAGLMRHTDRFGQSSFSSTEGAFTGGAGARVWMTDRVYALGEFRVGWEPHYRLSGGIGVIWR